MEFVECLRQICASSQGGGSVVARCELRRQRVSSSKPDSTEDPSCIGAVLHQIIHRGQRAPWCGAEIWKRGAGSGVVIFFWMDFVILNHSQMTMTTPELAPLFHNKKTKPF
ncbi:hypothetical protein AVEN_265729-1 [Araneus ventricosus]|uniref:Uncharacterized protein n=1 Tax=Araneus ventricosus TaxID=182803 RepID=A0A4Y2FJU8_ARAVE|nr:hypothetical protein AVEN_265729-1 [Araneus ventricosus]